LQAVVTIPGLLAWMGRHDPSVMLPRVRAVIADVRARFGATQVAAQGYCFGGRHAVQLGSGATPDVQVYAAAHPSRVAIPDELNATTVPGIYLLAEKDHLVGPKDIAAMQALAAKRRAEGGVATEVHVWSGVEHGFAVRGDTADPVVNAARTAAFAATVAFFNKHMPATSPAGAAPAAGAGTAPATAAPDAPAAAAAGADGAPDAPAAAAAGAGEGSDAPAASTAAAPPGADATGKPAAAPSAENRNEPV
jgi:hypothetical protein